MRFLFWILSLFALATGLAIAARYNDGYALFVLSPWRVQISLNFLLLLSLAIGVLIYFCTRLILRSVALPSTVKTLRQRKRKEHAVQAFRDAVRLYFEGRYGQSYRHANLAFDENESPGLAALLCARAAHMLRQSERCKIWLETAARYDSELRVARLTIEAEQALADRDYDGAVRALTALRANGQRHIAALRLFLQAEQGRKRWEEVVRLARQLNKHKVLTEQQTAPIIRRARVEQLREREGDLASQKQLWAQLPSVEQNDPRLLVQVAPIFMAADDHDTLLPAIETALRNEWDEELVLYYGQYSGGDLRTRLGLAEKWLSNHNQDAVLLLTLGRLCIHAKLWGKAQSYLEASLATLQTREAHIELAQLHETLHHSEKAAPHYRMAAQLCQSQASVRTLERLI